MWDIGCCGFSKYLKPANTKLEYNRSLLDLSEGRGVGIKQNLDGLKHINKSQNIPNPVVGGFDDTGNETRKTTIKHDSYNG